MKALLMLFLFAVVTQVPKSYMVYLMQELRQDPAWIESADVVLARMDDWPEGLVDVDADYLDSVHKELDRRKK